MVLVVDLLNRALTPLFDILCWPFLAVAPIWAMTLISLVSGVAMVWIFGKVSDQTTIKRLRENIRGNLIGVRLFQSDIGVVVRLQRRIFGDTFRYMRYALVPMVVLLVPVVPLVLEDLRNQPYHCFWALNAITGEQPIPQSAHGCVREMADAWIAWGINQQLIEADESGK